ncbi:papain-like cysteine protease family protein [Actinomadura violacea]|uniref:C39 family peptidase n=1 Tax=Actinomadura violacea TaxID=2819934 RepID=A0ABS3RNG9_9ACTN|nr:papain-like cysteine protease family protein [Actinomadura violacea]MBO2458296.1 C39 family peptidase [Actinomadura violacea]
MHVRFGRSAAVCALALAVAAVPGTADAAALRLDISMQAQEMSNWCWAASGDTVAAFMGKDYSQNQFCNLAFDRSVNSSCPNSQATLANDQTAFRKIGISPGNYVDGHLYYWAVTREIDARRPVIARIQWTSGGGHMEVLYGYDDSSNMVYWGNPWPSSYRYNWSSYDYYVDNDSFFWTHSLDYIGA